MRNMFFKVAKSSICVIYIYLYTSREFHIFSSSKFVCEHSGRSVCVNLPRFTMSRCSKVCASAGRETKQEWEREKCNNEAAKKVIMCVLISIDCVLTSTRTRAAALKLSNYFYPRTKCQLIFAAELAWIFRFSCAIVSPARYMCALSFSLASYSSPRDRATHNFNRKGGL